MKKLLANLILLMMVINILPADSSMSDGVSVEFVPSGYNLGIGTSSPNEKLTVNGNVAIQEQSGFPTRSTGFGKLFVNSTNKELYFQGNEAHTVVKLTNNGSLANSNGAQLNNSTLGNTVINGSLTFGSGANIGSLIVNGTVTAKNMNFTNGATITNFFGDWQDLELGRVYQAPGDGLVNIKLSGTDASFTRTSLLGYTDSSPAPSTWTTAVSWLYGYAITLTAYHSVIMPVKKDNYFIVRESDFFSSTGSNNAGGLTKEVQWMSLGANTAIISGVSAPQMDIIIDADINSEIRAQRPPSLVFVSPLIGYIFAIATNDNPFYRKTTDGGVTWGARVLLNSVTDCDGLTVWYDKWTPGGTGGYIHIVYSSDSANRLYYMNLNTSNDAVSTAVAITSATSVDVNVYLGYSITKSTTGILYASLANYYNGNYPPMVKCSSNCTTGTNWTAVANYPSGLVNTSAYYSDFKLAPLKSGQVLALYWDDNDNDIRYSIYTNGTNSWTASTTLDSSAVNNTYWEHAWGSTINPDTGDIYLCYNNAVHDTSGLIKTAIFSNGGSLTSTGSVTDSLVTQQYQCDLAYDQANSSVVLLRNVSYNGGSNVNQILIQKSSDAMSNWTTEEKISLINRDYRSAGLNFTSNGSGLIYAYYADDDNNDLYGNQVVNSNNTNDGWTQIYSEKFETTPTGWNNNSTIVCGTANRVLGGSDALTSLTKTISSLPAHTQIKLKFNYYSIDSWDDPETGFAQIAGTTVWTIPRMSYADSFRYSLCRTAGWTDYILRNQEVIRSHSASSVIIAFGSTLGTVSGSDESFAVDNVEIWVK